MKFLIILSFFLPHCIFAQKHKEPSEMLGPNPVYIIDSIKLEKSDFLKFDPHTVARLMILDSADAKKRFGPEGTDGAIIAETKNFARKHYIAYFRKKSHAFDSLYMIAKSDSAFQYIINDKVKTKSYEGDLATIDDALFLSLDILTADYLKKKYNINDKSIGILISARRPQDLFNWESKF